MLSIDLFGPTMAYVKLKCAIPPRFFTDQLSLLKIDGRWQIAQKVFMTEMRMISLLPLPPLRERVG